MIYSIAGLIFVTVAMLAYAGLALVFSEERQVTRRLQSLPDYERAQAQEIEPLLRPFRERVLSPIGSGLRGVGRAIIPLGYRADARRRLVTAGSPRGMDAERFLVLKVLGGAGALFFFTGMHVLVGFSTGTWLLVLLPLTILAFVGPDLWLMRRTSARQLLIRRTLPDMLDMLTISVEAGLGFDQAITKLVKNTHGPLAEEFGRMLQEVQAGVSRGDALRAMAERTQVTDLNTFIMAMIQADVFGISVSTILRTQAKEMRLKRRQYAEEMAQKAPVKLVFPLVLCILPATLIVILGPAVISIIQVFMGGS